MGDSQREWSFIAWVTGNEEIFKRTTYQILITCKTNDSNKCISGFGDVLNDVLPPDVSGKYLAASGVWEGGPLPGVNSPLFLPIAQEIQEHLGKKTTEEVKYGEPWKVRVPTSIVVLRKDDNLPEWEKNKAGEWETKEESSQT